MKKGNRSSLRLAIAGVCGTAAAIVGFAPSASAAPITGVTTLQDLINANQGNPNDGIPQGGVVVGDKQFYDFSYVGTPPPDPTGPNPFPNAPRADQIAVQTAPGPDIGLEFSFGWDASNGFRMDSLIEYKVHVLDPSQAINDVGLAFNGAAPVPGNATFASVTETVSSLAGAPLGVFSVFNDGTGGLPDNNTNSDPLAPAQRDLMVSKDINVNSAPQALGGGVATISLVDNTFHQASVPEPTTLGLLGGVAGIG